MAKSALPRKAVKSTSINRSLYMGLLYLIVIFAAAGGLFVWLTP